MILSLREMLDQARVEERVRREEWAVLAQRVVRLEHLLEEASLCMRSAVAVLWSQCWGARARGAQLQCPPDTVVGTWP